MVDVHASAGEEFLRTKVGADDGAARLGELALVDASSAVGRRGLLFRNLLFDENASSHIALGAGYTAPVPGASRLTDEERVAIGINSSAIHLDVMIGGPEVDATGVCADGSQIPILVRAAGYWMAQPDDSRKLHPRCGAPHPTTHLLFYRLDRQQVRRNCVISVPSS